MTDFSAANDRAVALDQKIMGDAGKISSNYVDLVSLATRQTVAAMDITVQSGQTDVKTFVKDIGGSLCAPSLCLRCYLKADVSISVFAGA